MSGPRSTHPTPTPDSITSSARSGNAGGMASAVGLAVARLTTRSYLVGKRGPMTSSAKFGALAGRRRIVGGGFDKIASRSELIHLRAVGLKTLKNRLSEYV